MNELIDRIAEQLGIDRSLAEQAVGIMLNLVKKEGDPSKAPDLMAALPGADALADAHGGGGGGLLGAIGGALGGGAIAAYGKLTQAGLSTDQIKAIGEMLFDHAREKAGEPLVKDAVSTIPGLKPYL